MTSLESLKNINKLKESAIKKGGYDKHRPMLEKVIKEHFDKFGEDYTPHQWTKAFAENVERRKRINKK